MRIRKLTKVYTLEKDYKYEVPPFEGEDISYYEKGALCALLSSKGILTLYKGFSWDGCTPKYSINDSFIIGTYDGGLGQDGYPILFHSSAKHDVLCRIFHTGESPYTRYTIDKIFQKDMKIVKWPLRGLYYSVVRLHAKIKGYK